MQVPTLKQVITQLNTGGMTIYGGAGSQLLSLFLSFSFSFSLSLLLKTHSYRPRVDA